MRHIVIKATKEEWAKIKKVLANIDVGLPADPVVAVPPMPISWLLDHSQSQIVPYGADPQNTSDTEWPTMPDVDDLFDDEVVGGDAKPDVKKKQISDDDDPSVFSIFGFSTPSSKSASARASSTPSSFSTNELFGDVDLDALHALAEEPALPHDHHGVSKRAKKVTAKPTKKCSTKFVKKKADPQTPKQDQMLLCMCVCSCVCALQLCAVWA